MEKSALPQRPALFFFVFGFIINLKKKIKILKIFLKFILFILYLNKNIF